MCVQPIVWGNYCAAVQYLHNYFEIVIIIWLLFCRYSQRYQAYCCCCMVLEKARTAITFDKKIQSKNGPKWVVVKHRNESWCRYWYWDNNWEMQGKLCFLLLKFFFLFLSFSWNFFFFSSIFLFWAFFFLLLFHFFIKIFNWFLLFFFFAV